MSGSGMSSIQALVPRSPGGVQFVQYADVLGGVCGRQDEALFQKANETVRRLFPRPEFLLFNGDHVEGYGEVKELKSQWAYFLETECAAFRDFSFPVYHAPGNHDVVSMTEKQVNPFGRAFPNAEAEDVYRRAFPDVPANGPEGQKGLSWYTAGGNFLLVVLHPIFSGRGATGFKELDWLDIVLSRFVEKEIKIVASHFPVFPVNGYDRHAPYPHASWLIDPKEGRALWDLMVRRKVSAYLCAHVCAFDVQIHNNIPQLCSAGGGHRALYPPWAEYHHIAQVCLDQTGFRVQSIDLEGKVRERCEWPKGGAALPRPAGNRKLSEAAFHSKAAELKEMWAETKGFRMHVSCIMPEKPVSEDQTLVCGWDNETGPPLFWLGIPAETSRLEVRALLFFSSSSPPYPAIFSGPCVSGKVKMNIIIDKTFGPGGVLYCLAANGMWNSMAASSAFGFEWWRWPPKWDYGKYQNRFPFRGRELIFTFKGV